MPLRRYQSYHNQSSSGLPDYIFCDNAQRTKTVVEGLEYRKIKMYGDAPLSKILGTTPKARNCGRGSGDRHMEDVYAEELTSILSQNILCAIVPWADTVRPFPDTILRDMWMLDTLDAIGSWFSPPK